MSLLKSEKKMRYNFFCIISSAALEISLKSSMRLCSIESYLQYAVRNPPAHTGARRWIEDSPTSYTSVLALRTGASKCEDGEEYTSVALFSMSLHLPSGKLIIIHRYDIL